MKTFHCEKLTGHTAAILEEIPAMTCIAKSSKSQENDPFYRSVWQGLCMFTVLYAVHFVYVWSSNPMILSSYIAQSNLCAVNVPFGSCCSVTCLLDWKAMGTFMGYWATKAICSEYCSSAQYWNVTYVINPFHPIRPYMASMQPLPIIMANFLGYLWTVSHIFNL